MIAITARGMPTPMPIFAPVDRFVEELSVVDGVGVVFDEKLCVVIGDELCVMTDDDGKSQPFTWIPYTAEAVCTVEVDMDQD
jgi:hypothetical protein